jgi:hypothetical protein
MEYFTENKNFIESSQAEIGELIGILNPCVNSAMKAPYREFPENLRSAM